MIPSFFSFLNSKLPKVQYFGISLRNATILIGLLYLINYCHVLVTLLGDFMEDHWNEPVQMIGGLVVLVIQIIVASILLLGIAEKRPGLLRPFILLLTFACVIFTVLAIIKFIGSMINGPLQHPEDIVLFFGVGCLFFYSAVVINSYHDRLQDEIENVKLCEKPVTV